MISIFIGLSQNQIESYEILIGRGLVPSGRKILLTNTFLKSNPVLWDEVLIGNVSFNNNSNGTLASIGNIIKKIKGFKEIIAQLKPYKNTVDIHLYFSYIEDILTNYLLLSFNPNIKGIVVEDGTLNYYSHTIKNLSQPKVRLKWLLSNLLGVRFKMYEGHSSGVEYPHVISQYVRIPEFSVSPEKSISLPYNSYDIIPSESVLVIGQEAYINMFGMAKYMDALSELINIVKRDISSLENCKVCYKPHRHGARIDYELLYDNFGKTNVEILSSETPLETLYFNEIKSNRIYGFDSSALVNINLEMTSQTRDKVDFTVLLRYNDELEGLFKTFNFRIFR